MVPIQCVFCFIWTFTQVIVTSIRLTMTFIWVTMTFIQATLTFMQVTLSSRCSARYNVGHWHVIIQTVQENKRPRGLDALLGHLLVKGIPVMYELSSTKILEQVTVESTLYTLNTYPRVPNFGPFLQLAISKTICTRSAKIRNAPNYPELNLNT